MTKVVYLIFYLWHTSLVGIGSGNSAVGGPGLSITEMPNIATCERVGFITKQFVDEQYRSYPEGSIAKYKCVELLR